MGKWNDTDVPLAYLITFRTYGTWVAGDVRGSIDRFHNAYRGPRAESSVIREQQQVVKLKSEAFLMNGRARRAVRGGLFLSRVANVRTNHAHAVVAAIASSNKVLGDLKAYATRKLRSEQCWLHAHSPWADKGSKRNLWNENQISAAIEYVVNGQGDDLPEFD
jgi:hypothetical protein